MILPLQYFTSTLVAILTLVYFFSQIACFYEQLAIKQAICVTTLKTDYT